MDKKKLKGWHYIPDVPLSVSPLFTLPLRPVAVFRWLWDSWFLISERLIIVGIAFLSFFYFQPPLEVTKTFHWQWIVTLYARNFILIFFIAGILHLWFYTYSKQGQTLKYDPRPLIRHGRQFTLNSQVRDNMFWTLGSGVFIWTAYEVLLFWALANGYISHLLWSDHPYLFIALFFFIPFWESFYFYWIHRLIHFPIFYKYIHSVHHRNINIGPWSGLSMHPVEHIIYLGSVMIHFIIGAHPIHLLFHLQYFTLTAVTTHTGFQGLFVKNKNRLNLGTFHHQMHHRYFECNYGSLEMPWDKWFGSFHDGTEKSHSIMQKRHRKKNGTEKDR